MDWSVAVRGVETRELVSRDYEHNSHLHMVPWFINSTHCLPSIAQHFPSNLHPHPDHTHQQRPMPTHAHPMLFKLCLCILKLCNAYYPPTPSLGWIGQIKGCSLSLASARSTSWLEYSLHPEV